MAAAERGLARNSLDAYRRDLACFAAHLAALPYRPGQTPRLRVDTAGSWRRSGAPASRRALPCVGSPVCASSTASCLQTAGGTTIPTAPVDSPALPRIAAWRAQRGGGGSAAGGGVPAGGVATAVVEQARGRRASPADHDRVALRQRASASRSWYRCRSTRCSSETQALLVRGKGDKERLVPLGAPARHALDAYLAVRERHLDGRCALPLALPLPRRERASHPPSPCADAEDGGASGGDRARPGSRRTHYAMPSQAIYSPTAPT